TFGGVVFVKDNDSTFPINICPYPRCRVAKSMIHSSNYGVNNTHRTNRINNMQGRIKGRIDKSGSCHEFTIATSFFLFTTHPRQHCFQRPRWKVRVVICRRLEYLYSFPARGTFGVRFIVPSVDPSHSEHRSHG